MPIPVSEILNPTPPPPPAPPLPPRTETVILEFLSRKPDQGFSLTEIKGHTASVFLKRIGLDGTLGGLAKLAVLSVLPTPKEQTEEEALQSLLKDGRIETRDYNGVPHYWAPAT